MKLRTFTIYVWRDQLIDFLLIFFVITPVVGTIVVTVLFYLASMINDKLYHS